MKKLLLLILTLALICGPASFAAASASGNYSYKVLSDGTAEITAYNGYESSVTIPEKLDGHVVSSIGSYAFMYKPVSSISIKADRITLKDDSFFGCQAKTIQIEAIDLVIGKEAFSCCSDIETFSIKANNTTIGKYAFMYAKPMKSFQWELADKNAAGTKTILEEGAFFSSNLVNISIPGDELVIGKEAFSCCPDIKSFMADCETINIGRSAFMYANALKTFSVPNANSSEKPGKIDDNAFFSCGLSLFVVPGCITKIGKDAFSCCSSLESVVIPTTVTSIGSGAFSLCSSSLVIKTEPESEAEKYCSKNWGVNCEYLSAAEMAEIYGEHYADAASQAQEKVIQEKEREARPKNETAANRQHTIYGYMKDKWNWYRASFQSDNTLKIEKWYRWNAGADGDPFAHSYDVCTVNITDGSTDFFWLDEAQTAFSISLTDKKDSVIDGSKRIYFAADDNEIDESSTFFYMNDKWHWYRAVALSETVIKVEKWSRFNAGADGDPFAYDSDICIIQANDTSVDFAWTDDEHAAFTITMEDEENSYWEGRKITPFTIEPDPAKHPCFTYQNDKWNLYKAYRISEKTISVENWSRFNAGEDGDPFSKEKSLCIIKTDDASTDFKWADDSQAAFTITLNDEENSYWEGERITPFAPEIMNVPVLSYLGDRWDLYRAFILSDNIIVIQDWTRFNAGEDGDPFRREYDVCLINPMDGTTDFRWTDNAHTAFTVTMQDDQNSYWHGKQNVTYTAGTEQEYASKIGGAASQKETEIGNRNQTPLLPYETDESIPEPTGAPTAQPSAEPVPTPETIADIIDLSGYTDDEIVMINRQVDAEIEKRGIVKSAVLQIGKYSVGDDLPAGSYLLEFAPTADKGHYFNYAVYNFAGRKINGDVFCTKQLKITLEEGQTLEIEREPVTITQYKGVFW